MIVKTLQPKKLQRCNYREGEKNANYNNVSMFARCTNHSKNTNKRSRI